MDWRMLSESLSPPLQRPSVMHQAPTPHLDRLMAEGTTFSRAYSASPKCSPSRYSIVTGRYPSSCLGLRPNPNGPACQSVKPGNLVPLTGADVTDNLVHMLSNKMGYAASLTGKWHLFNTKQANKEDLQREAKRVGFTHADNFYVANIGMGQGDEMRADQQMEWLVLDAVTFVNESVANNKPFFLHLNPVLPNGPGLPEALLNDPPTNIRLEFSVEPSLPPFWPGMPSRTSVLERAKASAPGQDDKSLPDACAMVWLDDAVGALLATLTAHNILDNTMIVLTSDHAASAKGELYEHGNRVPFVVRYPPSFAAGKLHTGLVSTIDIAPTVMDMLGTPDNALTMDGISLVKLVTGKAHRDHLVLEISYDRAVVTETHKYIFKPQGSSLINSVSNSNTGKVSAYPAFFDWEQL